jgi:DNA-binding transcriptional regulator YhcF (GntR family)
MNLAVDRDSGVPVGTQLTWRICSAIEHGELSAGDRLPSLREAADEADVNVNTVRAAYAKLETAGIVKTEQGRGTFVVARSPAEDGPDARRRLQEEIARLEGELVRLPLLPPTVSAPAPGGRARLLSVTELEAVRDVLADRVAELRAARGEIVRRIEERPSTADVPVRRPSRRSSSSLAGAEIRWTGA